MDFGLLWTNPSELHEHFLFTLFLFPFFFGLVFSSSDLIESFMAYYCIAMHIGPIFTFMTCHQKERKTANWLENVKKSQQNVSIWHWFKWQDRLSFCIDRNCIDTKFILKRKYVISNAHKVNWSDTRKFIYHRVK